MRLGRTQRAASYRSKAGRQVAIRQADARDTAALAALFGGLSAETVGRRYLMPRAFRSEEARREAERLTRLDDGRIVVVAQGEGGIVAVAELARDHERPEVGEGAMLVADAYQGQGIGRAVAEHMADAARHAAIRRVRATTAAHNTAVRRLIASSGRPYTARFAGPEVEYEVTL